MQEITWERYHDYVFVIENVLIYKGLESLSVNPVLEFLWSFNFQCFSSVTFSFIFVYVLYLIYSRSLH